MPIFKFMTKKKKAESKIKQTKGQGRKRRRTGDIATHSTPKKSWADRPFSYIEKRYYPPLPEKRRIVPIAITASGNVRHPYHRLLGQNVPQGPFVLFSHASAEQVWNLAKMGNKQINDWSPLFFGTEMSKEEIESFIDIINKRPVSLHESEISFSGICRRKVILIRFDEQHVMTNRDVAYPDKFDFDPQKKQGCYLVGHNHKILPAWANQKEGFNLSFLISGIYAEWFDLTNESSIMLYTPYQIGISSKGEIIHLASHIFWKGKTTNSIFIPFAIGVSRESDNDELLSEIQNVSNNIAGEFSTLVYQIANNGNNFWKTMVYAVPISGKGKNSAIFPLILSIPLGEKNSPKQIIFTRKFLNRRMMVQSAPDFLTILDGSILISMASGNEGNKDGNTLIEEIAILQYVSFVKAIKEIPEDLRSDFSKVLGYMSEIPRAPKKEIAEEILSRIEGGGGGLSVYDGERERKGKGDGSDEPDDSNDAWSKIDIEKNS